MIRLIVALPLVFVLLIASHAQAQSPPQPSRLFRTLLVTQAVGQLADGATTAWALKRPGLREANPLLPNNPAEILAVKSGLAVATTWALRRLYPSHRKVATVLALALTSVSSSAAIHNWRVQR